MAGVAPAGRRAAGVGVGAALLGWRRLPGLRGARCWAWAAGGAGVAHSRLTRVAARAGLGRRGVCAAWLAGGVRGAMAGGALRGGPRADRESAHAPGRACGRASGPCSAAAGERASAHKLSLQLDALVEVV